MVNNNKKKDIIENLINLLEKSIRKNIPKKKFGLLLSGGLDSSIIAYILKTNKCKFKCYVVEIKNSNFKPSEDIIYTKKLAKDLGLNIKVIKIKDNQKIEQELKTVLKLIKKPDTIKTSLALPIQFALKQAKKDGCEYVFYGGGCDSIFAGFEKHKQSTDINKQCLKSFKECKEKAKTREIKLANYNKLKLIFPFLDKELVNYTLKIPGKYKIKNNVEKYILRETAKKIGLPKYITERKKKAIQYSSNCQKSLKKLAKKKGFKKIKNYLQYIQNKDIVLK